MLKKLLRKSLTASQVITYGITLLVGVLILLLTVQLYVDLAPMLRQNSSVFKKNAVVVSKNISVLKSMDKGKVAFSDKETTRLKEQEFVKGIAFFRSSRFHVAAYIEQSEDIPLFYTDLFFESVPDDYLDISTSDWKWNPDSNFIPIIIPEAYLNLYNFGFAESQNLPVISPGLISRISFNLKLSGNGKTDHYVGRIVAFTEKINSILVPDDFLQWANQYYAYEEELRPGRLLVEFENPSDEQIARFFHENNYSINQNELEMSRLFFFFRLIFTAFLFIALIIVILSLFYIILSVKLILERKKETILNLAAIGYNYKQIASHYQRLVSVTSIVAIALSCLASLLIRQQHVIYFRQFFEITTNPAVTIWVSIGLMVILLSAYNVVVRRTVRRNTGQG
ncbi:hypothetical protein LJC68_06390 [Bacteroidales bacterium OttesenSCG-928-B11]|nr:hypothetical protein [Bacteroidales bacterium OttesenSCG-928-E04]MDL2312489.1 hypothetical protein [Bacteroidales bacterium OttesenSCG-928-B11]MDL2325720.1 hypothetical protein [Bacteroidales bacterium OttesenSCG-928-A14]